MLTKQLVPMHIFAKLLRAIALLILCVTSGFVAAECQPTKRENGNFSLSLVSAAYNSGTGRVDFTIYVDQTYARWSDTGGCSGGMQPAKIVLTINVDGAAASKVWVDEGYHTLSLPVASANSVVLSGVEDNGGTVVVTGASYSNYPVSGLNRPPAVGNVSVGGVEDQSKTISLVASDPDAGDYASFSIVGAPANGTANIGGNTLTYTPPQNWNGTTALSYLAIDSKGAASNTATITITVAAVNDIPAVVDRTISTNEDAAGSLTLTVADVDLGREGDSHTWSIVTAPDAAHGTAAVIGSTLTFTPAPNWSGTTTLTYRAKDSANAFSNTATVTVTVNPVNDAPVAQAKTIVTDEDTPDTVTLTATDIDSPAPSTFQVVTNPAQGTASIIGNELTYTPLSNWSGSTSLTYRAQDSGGAWSAPVTVSITVNPINDVPVVQAKSITAAEDSSGSVTLTVTDPDIAYGDSHAFEIVSAPNAAHGSASITGSTLTFTPVANWNGSTSLTYRAKDEQGAYSAPATVSITITAVNDAPVSAAKSASTDEDVPASITLSATDIDSPVPTVFQVVAAPNATYGAVSIGGSTATFTPVPNWHGTATFTYRAQDAQGAWSAAVTVTITVNAVNDTPEPSSNSLSLTTKENQPATAKYLVTP